MTIHPSSLILRPSQDGFTFLEVMIALAIAGIAIIAVFNTVNYHADVASEHIIATRMYLAAKEKLVEMEKNPVNQKGSIPDTGFAFETTAENFKDGEDAFMRNIIEVKAIIRGQGKEIELSRLVSGNFTKREEEGQE